ncbi:MAG TPA: serine hydrolase, partial [Kofleriaceae bacterium]
LGMTHSSFDQNLTRARLQHAAVGYGPTGQVVDGKRFRYPEMAAAGLWTTPSDLARFFIEVAKGRAGTSKVVSKQIAMQMTTQLLPIEGAGGIGLGVFLMTKNGAGYFGHGGADTGFQASAVASLEGGNGVIIMANSDNGHRIFSDIERTVIRVSGWPGAATPIDRFPLEPAQRKRFVGRYHSEAGPFEIIERDGKLVLRTPFSDGNELVPTGADIAIATSDATEIRLAADGLRLSNDGRPARPAVRPTTDHPLFLLEAGKFDEAVVALKASKSPREEEDRINFLGYQTMGKSGGEAAEIFRLNVSAFPDSANAHDSYGEALGKIGKTAEAIAAYERMLVLLPDDPRIPATDKAAFKKHGEEALARLRGP